MSALADAVYYTDVYKGTEVYDDLDVLLERASDIVRQQMTCHIDDISVLPSFMQENIKKAVCAEAEYINSNGGFESLGTDSTASFTIGKFSVSGGSSSGGTSSSYQASPRATAYLEAVGLLYRGGIL